VKAKKRVILSQNTIIFNIYLFTQNYGHEVELKYKVIWNSMMGNDMRPCSNVSNLSSWE
jgi:hypothetical protein